jgi:hypothetical protein
MKLTGENQSTRGRTCPSVTSTTNPTWTNPGFFFLQIQIYLEMLLSHNVFHFTTHNRIM